MSPRPFVITINTRLSFFFSHLCCPPSFFSSRAGSILRGQPPVLLRNAIIMRPIIIGERANFCHSAAARNSSRHEIGSLLIKHAEAIHDSSWNMSSSLYSLIIAQIIIQRSTSEKVGSLALLRQIRNVERWKYFSLGCTANL